MTRDPSLRVGILGPGALGGLFGGYLQHSGREVYLLARDPGFVEVIDDEGLTVERPGGDTITVHPETTTTPASVTPVDVLFVCVKAIQTEQAIQDALPVVHDETVVVTVQNGLKNVEILSEYVAPGRVIGGTTTEGASLLRPGHVLHTGRGATKIGGEDDEGARIVADHLKTAGIETTVVDDPAKHIWEKQLVSVAIKPTAALTELQDGPLAEHEDTAWVMDRLVDEAVAVAAACGVDLHTEDPMAVVREVCSVNYETTSSMLEDVQEKRRTEIDHINGAIVDYAQEHDIEVPFNRMATALVKGKEQSYRDTD